MKILSIGNFLNPSWDGSRPDEEHIAGALEELGHEVTRLQREEVSISTFFDSLMHQSPNFYDFVLIAQWDGYPLDLFSNWKKAMRGTEHIEKIVYWAFDYQADGQEWHERLVAEADLYLSKRIADSKYPNWRWLSQDFAPKMLGLDSTIGREEYEDTIDVLFTGSYLPWATERNATLKAIDEKYNLVIHSVNAWEGFKDVRPPIMDEGLPALYHSAKINVSIDHTLEAGYWSDRNAQIMTCGGFVLFRYVPLSETVFRDNIAYFYSIEDCLKKIEYYLDGSSAGSGHAQAKMIADKGYRYAWEYLGVKNRVQDLLTIVKSIL